MAEMNPGQERSELATPRKRQKAREQGNVARSTEISSVVVFGAAIVALQAFGPKWAETFAQLFRDTFTHVGSTKLSEAEIVPRFAALAQVFGLAFLPFAGVVMLAGVASQMAQVGVLWTTEPMSPKWERISPVSGFQRLFSKRALMELTKSLLKIGLVGALLVWTISDAPNRLLSLAAMELTAAYGEILRIVFKMAGAAAFALAFLALLDFLFQRYDYEKQLMMTRAEVKQEHKETEGDPLVKAFIRSTQREMSRKRMMEGVKKADVVVTNPIHFAVALQYDPSNMKAPKIVAKGQRLVARKIREIALAAGIPVIEDPPLARALHKSGRVGAEIPIALYKAVADLLAFVYRRSQRALPGVPS